MCVWGGGIVFYYVKLLVLPCCANTNKVWLIDFILFQQDVAKDALGRLKLVESEVNFLPTVSI